MQFPSSNSFVPTSSDLQWSIPAGGSRASEGVFPRLARSRSAREREEARRRVTDLTTRALNVVLASVLLLLTLPIMLVIALVVRLTSPGPVFFVQDRVGLDQRRRSRRRGARRFENDRRRADRGGRLFKIYKFRTMRPSNGDGPQVWAQEQDPRITPIGRILRAHRLDELPQLFNVLKGDMNLVGPRPEQPAIFEQLRQSIDRYSERQSVRPGITGWAQVNLGYDGCLNDVRRKLMYDLEYVRRQSVVKDLVIVAKTPQVMLFKQGSR